MKNLKLISMVFLTFLCSGNIALAQWTHLTTTTIKDSLGVGTQTPEAALHVYARINSSYFDGIKTDNPNGKSVILITGKSGAPSFQHSSELALFDYNRYRQWSLLHHDNNNLSFFNWDTLTKDFNHPFKIKWKAPDSSLVINDSGYIGMGVENAQFPLHVFGTNKEQDIAIGNAVTSDPQSSVGLSLGNGTDYRDNCWRIMRRSGSAFPTNSQELHSFQINYWKDSTMNERMMIDTSGNFFFTGKKFGFNLDRDLGNMPNDYTLYVGGGILTEKVKCALQSSANWSDYVFDADYKLKTLEEVETYIQENGHLPGIPSADTLVDEGIDLVEMNASLLAKIEELTLYVIQLKKEIDNQNQPETR